MPPLNILISGAGIAGCTTAYFLSLAGHNITVIERFLAPRTGGQNVDVRGHGLTILRHMGVESLIQAKATHEEGMRFVDSQNRTWAEFPVGDGKGFTSDMEIMRGDLAKILYEKARESERVTFVFGESIAALSEDEKGVEVGFENGRAKGRFDVVIAADGLASRTRKLAFGPEVSRDAVRSLGQWTGLCTIPQEETDTKWAQWYSAPGKRMVLLRPDSEKISRVSIWVMPEDDRFEKAAKASVEEQKQLWARTFEGAGWQTKRIIDGMLKSDDFYVQKIAQVKMPSWSKGRVALVGDAGYCPSPISGMGTTVAIVGAYVLAGELAQNPADPEAAFAAYEKRCRGFITTAQKLAPGAPGIANPKTQWGIWVLYSFLRVVSWIQSFISMGASFVPPATATEFPEYKF